MSALADKQAEFTRLQARLVRWVYTFRFKDGRPRRLRDGWAYRSMLCNKAVGGHKRSRHKTRLARDWILDIWNGEKWVYQRSTKAYREIGEAWERMHPDARWGGRWGDGNHFSFQHAGVK